MHSGGIPFFLFFFSPLQRRPNYYQRANENAGELLADVIDGTNALTRMQGPLGARARRETSADISSPLLRYDKYADALKVTGEL